jgi:lipopolysaccharide transport system ATP-binding protein
VQEYLRDISQVSTTPLVERTDRWGSGEIRFVSVLMEGRNGSSVSAFQCGAEVTLRLVMENRTSRELRDFRISLGIDNEMGQRVALLDTMLVGTGFSCLPTGQASVRVIIRKMALAPGRYRLTMFSIANNAIADWIENAGSFDVEAGDFYGRGQLMLDEQGKFLLDHQFTVAKISGNC